MFKGFDSYSTPSDEVLRRAKSEGFDCAIQYYGPAGSPKVTTAADMARIGAAGLHVFMVFERYQRRALEGANAGKVDAELALAQAHAAGQPDGTAIAFAVDSDVDTSNVNQRNGLLGYFGSVKQVLLAGKKVVAGYGGGSVLSLLTGTGMITVPWLAGAGGWSGSRDYLSSDKWLIRQYPEIAIGAEGNVLGIAYDVDDIRDLGQVGAWLPGSAASQPGQPPIPEASIPDPRTMQEMLIAEGYSVGPDGDDGKWGDDSSAALMRYYQDHRG